MTPVGPVGRLGAWTASHFRAVLVAWIVLAVGLGVLRPTRRDGALRRRLGGVGLSSRCRRAQLIDRNFGGQSSAALMVVVHSPTATVGRPAVRRRRSTASP